MNFRKVSENELHCSVSAEEIRENGLEVSDLLKRSDKTYEFFEYLMREGQEETGFEKNGPMSVEGVFLNGNLELIFRCLDIDEENEFWEELESGIPKLQRDEPPQPDIMDADGDELQILQLRFSSVARLHAFCKRLQISSKIPSTFYELDGNYVLVVDMDACTKQELGTFCMTANEYGAESIYGDLQASYVLEHGRYICDDPLHFLGQMGQAESV